MMIIICVKLCVISNVTILQNYAKGIKLVSFWLAIHKIIIKKFVIFTTTINSVFSLLIHLRQILRPKYWMNWQSHCLNFNRSERVPILLWSKRLSFFLGINTGLKMCVSYVFNCSCHCSIFCWIIYLLFLNIYVVFNFVMQ